MRPLRRAAALAHATTAGYSRRLDRSRHLIEKHPDHALSISWGKDSVVMLHLACTVLSHPVAIHARYSSREEYPDLPAVRDALLARLSPHYIEIPMPGEWELFERCGGPFFTPETEPQKAAWREWGRTFVARMDQAVEDAGCAGKMIGLCAHESRARRLNRARRGVEYQAAGQLPTLTPIADLTPDDIIAYHVEHDLPWLHIYDVADDPRRARSEVCFVADGGASDAIRRHGAWEEWRHAYPDWWAGWVSQWPELRGLG